MRWLLLYPRHPPLRRLFSSSPPVETHLDVLLLSSHLCPPADNPLYGAAVKEFALSRIDHFEGMPWQLRAVRLGSQWRFGYVRKHGFHSTRYNSFPCYGHKFDSHDILCIDFFYRMFQAAPLHHQHGRVLLGSAHHRYCVLLIAYCSLHIAHCVLRIACFSISSIRGSHAPPLRDP